MPKDRPSDVARDIAQTPSPSLERSRLLLKMPLATFIKVYPDAVFLYDVSGRIVMTNAVARRLFGLDAASTFESMPYVERLKLLAPRSLDGQLLAEDEWSITRILNGEVITDENASIVRMRSLDGRELVISYTGAPIHDNGALIGGFTIVHDLTERRRLEEETQSRTAQLEAILDAITDGIYVYDRNANLVRTNSAAQRLNPQTTRDDYLERRFGERIGPMSIWDEHGRLVAPEDVPVSRVLRGEVLTGAHAVDSVVQFPDGRLAQVNTTGAPVTDATGAVAGGVIVTRDVTDHRQLERRTRDSLDSLLAMARAAVGVSGPSTAEAGAGMSAAIHELAELARRVITCERVAIMGLDADDHIIPVAVAGISEREMARWTETARGVPLAAFLPPEIVARLRKGEALIIDTASTPRREVLFGAAAALVAPTLIGDRLTGVLSIGSAPTAATYTGDDVALASAVAQLVALVMERDRLVRESAAAQAQVLALTETTRRMDEFLGIVSHELRTPLTVVSASLQLAERRIQRMIHTYTNRPPEEWRFDGSLRDLGVILNRALGSATRQARLVHDLLDVSRIKAGKLELRRKLCDLRDIVGDTVEELRPNDPERALTLDLPEAPVAVLADPDRVGQVVTNFVLNALKYSAPDTSIAVRLETMDDRARLSVRDAGPGIPIAERERVWDLFYRVPGIEVRSGSGVGLGLGLHISKTIIERHGGMVGVEGEPGQGATFWFTLPLAQETGDASTD